MVIPLVQRAFQLDRKQLSGSYPETYEAISPSCECLALLLVDPASEDPRVPSVWIL